MRIDINERFSIGADAQSWFICEKKTCKRNGQVVKECTPILWYTSLEAAVNGLAGLSLRLSDAQTLSEALLEVERLMASLCKVLQTHYEVRRRAA